MKIVINRIPISKKRHKCRCMHGIGMAYDPQMEEMNEIRKEIRYAFHKAFNSLSKRDVLEASEIALGSTFDVKMTFYLPAPRSLAKRKLNALLWHFSPCVKKPDLDNLAKLFLDCATGVIWKDDALIETLTLKKRFSENPRTEIEIMAKKDLTQTALVSGLFAVITPGELQGLLDDAIELSNLFDGDVEEFISVAQGDLRLVVLSEAAGQLKEMGLKWGALMSKLTQVPKRSLPPC